MATFLLFPIEPPKKPKQKTSFRSPVENAPRKDFYPLILWRNSKKNGSSLTTAPVQVGALNLYEG